MDIYDQRVKIAKAFANKTRIKIIDVLREEDTQCVCDLTEKLEVNQSSISKHLSILQNAGIVDYERDGLYVCYFLNVSCINNFFECIDGVIKSNLEKAQKSLNE